MSIQYTVPGFEPMTFWTWVSSHNQYTRAQPSNSRYIFEYVIFWEDIYQEMELHQF